MGVPYFLGMLLCSLAVSPCTLAMLVSRGSELLRFFVVAVVVVMGCLAVVIGHRLMFRSSFVMMLAGRMPLFHCLGA
jgi:hypothetical protein